MNEQPPENDPSHNERKWYEDSPRELLARKMGKTSVRGASKMPISTKLGRLLYGEECDEWSKERLKPYAWRLMPPGMRSAKGLLNEVAYQTVEPGPVILLKQGDAKARILAKRKALKEEEAASFPQQAQQKDDNNESQ